MNRHHVWIVLLIPLIASMATAQERSGRGSVSPLPEQLSEEVQQTYKQLENEVQEVPKRDFKVKTEAEPVKTQLFRVDPKLLEIKFVSNFVLMPAELNWSNSESFAEFRKRLRAEDSLARNYPDRFRPLVAWEQTYIFRPHHGVGGRASDVSLHEQIKLLAENCPEENRPGQTLIDALTAAVDRGDIQRRKTGFLSETGKRISISDLNAWQFTVYASTAEEARKQSAAILQLLDCGLSWPMQRFALEQGKTALAEARQAETEIATVNKAIEVERANLAKPSEISDDILSQLKAQKIMVAIELSGLIARVKACDEMLVKPLPANTLASIGDMKVKAEIDRIGIKEKLDQINALIAEGDARQGARARLLTLTAAKQRAQSSLSSAQTTAAWYADIFELYAPLQLEGNQITISPIEWTN